MGTARSVNARGIGARGDEGPEDFAGSTRFPLHTPFGYQAEVYLHARWKVVDRAAFKAAHMLTSEGKEKFLQEVGRVIKKILEQYGFFPRLSPALYPDELIQVGLYYLSGTNGHSRIMRDDPVGRTALGVIEREMKEKNILVHGCRLFDKDDKVTVLRVYLGSEHLIEENYRMVPQEIRAAILASDAEAEFREASAVVRQKEAYELYKRVHARYQQSVHQGGAFTITTTATDHGLDIQWRADNLYGYSHVDHVFVYKNTTGLKPSLHHIDPSTDQFLARSAGYEGHVQDPLRPGERAFYMFFLDGTRHVPMAGWRGLIGRRQPLTERVDDSYTGFERVMPRPADPIEEAERRAGIAQAEAAERTARKTGRSEDLAKLERMKKELVRTGVVLEMLELAEADRKRKVSAVEKEKLSPEEKHAKIAIINQIYNDLALRIRSF